MPQSCLPIRDIFRRVLDAADGRDVSIGDIIDAFGTRAYGSLLFLVGLIMVSPVGAIPGAPAVAATLVVTLTVQALLRRGPPWMPQRLRRVSIESGRLRGALERALPYFAWLDRVSRPRLVVLMQPPFAYLWLVASALIALLMLPLGFIPFAAAVPAGALAILGLGLINSDGWAAIVGLGVAGGAVALVLGTVGAAVS